MSAAPRGSNSFPRALPQVQPTGVYPIVPNEAVTWDEVTSRALSNFIQTVSWWCVSGYISLWSSFEPLNRPRDPEENYPDDEEGTMYQAFALNQAPCSDVPALGGNLTQGAGAVYNQHRVHLPSNHPQRLHFSLSPKLPCTWKEYKAINAQHLLDLGRFSREFRFLELKLAIVDGRVLVPCEQSSESWRRLMDLAIWTRSDHMARLGFGSAERLSFHIWHMRQGERHMSWW